MAQGSFSFFTSTFRLMMNRHIYWRHVSGFGWRVHLIDAVPSTTGDYTNPPRLTDFNEVSGGNYTEVGLFTFTEQQNDGSLPAGFQEPLGTKWRFWSTENPLWNQDPLGPTNIRAALLCRPAEGIFPGEIDDIALGFVDLTPDGTTPLSLRNGSLSITWNASGIFTVG